MNDQAATDPNPPSEWRRVRLEPTEAMWAAAFAAGYDSSPADFHDLSIDAVKSLLLPACRAMLAAAPISPPVEVTEALDALRKLEKAATRVSDLGAVTGSQWVGLTSAILKARAILKLYAGKQEATPSTLSSRTEAERKVVEAAYKIFPAWLEYLENTNCGEMCDKTYETQGCIGHCALADGKKHAREALDSLPPAAQGEPELKCVNGHDRCYLGPDEDCPYCERKQP